MRITYIDNIKAFAILLVVFCHAPLLDTDSIIANISMLLCWSAVPLFFMCTGTIYLDRKMNILKSLKSFFECYSILVIWKLLYAGLYFYLDAELLSTFTWKQLLAYLFLFETIDGINVGHLWFMQAYLIILLLLPIFQASLNSSEEVFKRKQYLLYLLILSYIFGIGLQSITMFINLLEQVFSIDLIDVLLLQRINPFGNYTNMIFFTLLGGYLSYYDLPFNKKRIKLISVICVMIGLLGLLLIKYWQTGSITWDNVYLKNGYKWTSTAILSLGIYLLFKVCSFENSMVSTLGKSTLGIYYLHWAILCVLRYTVYPWIKVWNMNINVFKTLLVVIMALCMIKLFFKIKLLKFKNS